MKADYPAKPIFDPFAARARREGWSYHELPAGHDSQAEMPDALSELLLKTAVRHHLVRYVGDLLDDRPWRRARRKHAHEHDCYQIGKAGLDIRWNLRRRFQPPIGAGNQNPNLSEPVHFEHLRRDAGGKHRKLPAVEIREPRIGALVRHMHDVREPRNLLEQLAAEVRRGADTGRAVG